MKHKASSFDISSYLDLQRSTKGNGWKQMLVGLWGKEKSRSLFLGLQTIAITMEISVKNYYKTKNKSTIWPIYTKPEMIHHLLTYLSGLS